MKYSQETLLDSCHQFVPALVEHRMVAHATMPTLLKASAEKIFCDIGMNAYTCFDSFQKVEAALIIQQALIELREFGFLTFGDK